MNDYSSVLMTEAGKLPYLNNITLSNAESIYWERVYSKKTKTYRYEYSVLYPFPEATRRQLIEAFLAIDDAKQAEYERLRGELETITDLDRIQQNVNELDGLYGYFFDATRKGAVETLKTQLSGALQRAFGRSRVRDAGRPRLFAAARRPPGRDRPPAAPAERVRGRNERQTLRGRSLSADLQFRIRIAGRRQ